VAISYYGKEYWNRFLKKETASCLAVTLTLGILFQHNDFEKCPPSYPSLRGAALGAVAISYYGKEYCNRFLKKETASCLAMMITLGIPFQNNVIEKCPPSYPSLRGAALGAVAISYYEPE
jgi:hypothetical protein